MAEPARSRVNPRKLLLSKWTARAPRDREKHFLVTELVTPDPPTAPVVEVHLQAVHSGRSRRLAWRELTDTAQWLQGWR